MNFPIRGLEIHSQRMWNWESVRRTLELCELLEINTLVFHQNELLDDLMIPEDCLTDAVVWDRWPLRQSRALRRERYIMRVISACRDRGIDFYMEIKEPWFPSDIFDIIPDLKNDQGVICPTHPFWNEYVGAKVRKAVKELPGLAGIIVSPATFETKLTIAANGCGCERCRRTSARQWYSGLIRSMYVPLQQAKKRLIVRDFAYTEADQNNVIEACHDVSKEITVSLKAVPHDYWPTFPDNPKIGNVGELRQWIEYDVWGQYMGCGLFPVSMIRDLRRRLFHCLQCGAEGVVFRTDWEHLQDCSVVNSLNMLNLFAGGMLAKNPEQDQSAIYRAYCTYGINSPLRDESALIPPEVPSAGDAPALLEAFMEKSYETMIATLYVRGHVMQYSSRFHHSFNFVDYVLLEHHTLEYWKPGALREIEPNLENLAIIYREKAFAEQAYRELAGMDLPGKLGVSMALRADLEEMIELYGWYVRVFGLVCHSYFDLRIALDDASEGKIAQVEKDIKELEALAHDLDKRMNGTQYPRYVYWLLSPETLLHFVRDMKTTSLMVGKSKYTFGEYDRSHIFETQVV